MVEKWRERLKTAIETSGKSMRNVSLEAGCNPGYLFDVLKGKDPTIDKLAAVAKALGVSLSWVLYGIEMNQQDEELLSRFSELSEKQRQAFLDLAKATPANDH